MALLSDFQQATVKGLPPRVRYFRVREVYHNKADPYVFPLREARDAMTRSITNPTSAKPLQVTDDGEGDSKDINVPTAGGHVADARVDQTSSAPLEQGVI